MSGYPVKPAQARKAAREFFDRGFQRQKWFFMNGPADGTEGLKQNIELVRQLREELGRNARHTAETEFSWPQLVEWLDAFYQRILTWPRR